MVFLELPFLFMFHPTDGLYLIKSIRKKINYIPVIMMLLLIIAVRIVFLYTVHYPLTSIDYKATNIWLEILRMVLPIVVWSVSAFFITSEMSGESKFMEILTASVYCMMPYILLSVPFSLFSNILGKSEAGLFNIMTGFIWAWVLINFFRSVMVLNTYTFFKTLGVCLVIIVCMLVLLMVAILAISLTGQIIDFIIGLIREIRIALY